MYKLREARLKDFYTVGDMDATSGIGLTKTPLTPSHGESLVDQSFQSFKTKEIRDSESPTHELKFTTRPSGVIAPDTSGWNVVTSSEVSPDGKAYRSESLATTEGVKKLSGGHSQFAGKNEQVTQESHEGDDRNYVRKAGESSKTQLQESSVVGDEKSGRMESKSSTVVSSSSQTTTSKFTSSGDDFEPIPANKQQILQQFDELADSAMRKLSKSSHQEHRENIESRSSTKEERHHHHEEKRQQQQNYQVQNEKYVTEGFTNENRLQSNQTNINTNKVEQVHEKTPKVTKVYLEEEVNKLAALPGTLISRKIDYPDTNTKMITETKELADGTIVTTKRYETKSAKSKTWQSDSRDEKMSTSRTHHEDRSQNKYSTEREIQDKTNKRIHDTDRRSSEFTNEADRRSSQIRREDIQKQNVQQKQTHEQVSRNESFQKKESHSVHREEIKRHDSDIRDHQIKDVVDRTDRRRDQVENLKDQVEYISSDNTHKTVKKDLSQTMRNEKITNQDFIETERGCVMIDRSSRRPDQQPISDKQYSSQFNENTETTRTVRKDSDFSTHGFPSVGPGKPQDKSTSQHRKPSDDFTTHGFPSVGSQKPTDKIPRGPKEDYSTHGYPSARPQTDSTKHVNEEYETRKTHESYSTHHGSVDSRTNRTQPHDYSSPQKKPSTDFTTNGFPSVKSQKYVQESRHGSVRDGSTTEENYTSVRRDEDFTTQGYPDHHRSAVPRESPIKEKVISEQQDRASIERQQTEFETYGFPSTKPKSKPKTDDFKGTHGYPSAPRHPTNDQKFSSIADDTSSVTTEQTEILERNDSSKTRSTDYITSSRITVDVDAAHDAFARSLRCVSPVDQQRPVSSKSIRTSSGSVRSSISPDKRSHRSPSRESGTYSESSRISSSTVTKSRGVDSNKRVPSKISPTKPSDTGRVTKKISDSNKSNETVDLTGSKFDRHNATSRSFKKISENKYATSDHSAPRSPHSSPERPTVKSAQIPSKPKTTKPLEPVYDVPKSNKKVSPQLSPDKISGQPADLISRKSSKVEDETKRRTIKTEFKKHVTDDEGFEGESPRSGSPTCSASDVEYHRAIDRSDHQVTDLDAADITVEVNLKHMGRNVNLIGTVGDDSQQHTVNRDFISKERENIELNKNRRTVKKENVDDHKEVTQKIQNQVIEKEYLEKNGYNEVPSDENNTLQGSETQPKKREPFYLKQKPGHEDDPKKPEDIKKPKTKPVLTRSETYEERCRQILGMGQDIDSDEVKKTITTVSRQETAKDFLTTERINEEKNKEIKQTVKSFRSGSPKKITKSDFDTEVISTKTTTKNQKIVIGKDDDDDEKTYDSLKYGNRSSSPSPIRRSKAPTRETSPSKRSDQPIMPSEDSSYYKKTTSSRSQSSMISASSRSPYSSPSRKSTPKDTPNETPQTRSPALSPTRKSTHKSPGQSPTRYTQKSKSDEIGPGLKPLSEKKPTLKSDVKISQEKTSVTSISKKETVARDKHVMKDKSPEQPNHITTAKIHLSPTLTRKPSTSDMKKSSYSPDTKSKPRPTTNIPTPRDEKTYTTTTQQQTHITKSTSEKPVPEKLTTRLVTQKRDQTPVQSTQKTITEKKSVTKFERSKTDTDRTTIQKVAKLSDVSSPKKASPKKLPITERKESAPVYRTPRIETDTTTQKMARSTSENLIKTASQRTKPEIEVSTSKGSRKNSTDKPRKNSFERRPSKCMTTKTINLTTNTLINSEDMENVIIDIQQAKSSREPSPNKIIPTPVPLDEDTGMPRYPDNVQEPDEQPRRSKIKNIPIFEEENKEYVGCQITEVQDIDVVKRKTSSTRSTKDHETTTFETTLRRSKEGSPVKEYGRRPTPDETDHATDECLLSVHDKVTKFISTAEQIQKPKTSAPFRREEPVKPDTSEPDDCYLSVTDKVAKFLTSAENVTKSVTSSTKTVERPKLDDLDDELKTDECVLSVSEKVNKFTTTVDKLSEPYQQKSAELVAQIDRQMSRSQTASDETTLLPEDNKGPKPSEVTEKPKPREKSPASKPSGLKSTEIVQKAKSVFEKGNVFSPTKPRQRDILSRPSVWEAKTSATDVKLQDIGIYKKDQKDHETVTESHHLKGLKTNDSKDGSKPRTKTTKPLTVISDSVSSKKSIFENKISSKPSPQLTKPKSCTHDRPKDFSPSGTRSKPAESTIKISEKSPKKFSERTVASRSPERSPNHKEIDTVEKVTSQIKHTEYETHSTVTDKLIKDEQEYKTTTHRDMSPKPYEKVRYSNRQESPTREPLESSKSQISPKTPQTRTPADYILNRETSDAKKDTKTSRISKTEESVSAKRSLFEKPDIVSVTASETRPSYMDHTVSSLEHRRDSTEITKMQSRRSSASKESEIYETKLRDANARPVEKFGVELRRTNSKDGGPRRKSSCSEIPHIEEIFDLELLEQMLNTVVGYEQRRRIRTQIRLVKKMMENQIKKDNQVSHRITTKRTEYTTSSRASSKSPERYQNRYRNIIGSPDEFTQVESKEIVTRKQEHVHSERSISPVSKTRTVTTVEEIRKIGDKPATKKVTTTTEISDGKPIWTTKNILKKASENNRVPKPASASKSSVSTKTRTQRQQHTTTDEDCITSSYGIGPTDEDGRPLFGIRALKKKSQPGETTKVTGKVVTEKYYSENGAEPTGERSVTVFSTNSDDIDTLEKKIDSQFNGGIKKTTEDGVTSITKTRKIGKQQGTELPAITNVSKVSTTKITPKIVRKGSVKEISEKFIRKESSSSVTEKTSTSSSYPKAGLILHTKTHETYDDDNPMDYDDPVEECDIEIKTTRKHSKTVLNESDSEEELRRTRVNKSTRSFLNSSGSKVTGVEDVLDRMRNADNVIEDGDTIEDQEARALLNKFLGASVLMSGVESMVPKEITSTSIISTPNSRKQEVKTTRITKTIKKEDSSSPVARKTCDIEEIFDEELLNKLLEHSTSVEERRKIRARLRQLMAEREESCTTETTETKEEDGAVVKTTTKVTTRTVSATSAPKPVSPFAKFRQLDKQNSVQTPSSPLTPSTPGGSNRGAPIFKFTDPALNARAATVKDQLLQWCQMKTKEYENVQISNFSASWTDGLAFCALIHHFLPDAFDYSKLTPKERRHNFELAFRVADEKAGIAPLLDVEDMVVMKRPDWKCVFTYVQSIYRRFRNYD